MKIVVLDDDPTGSQTVHGCLLLLRWDVDVLRYGMRHPSPLLFVLANTRALAGGIPQSGNLFCFAASIRGGRRVTSGSWCGQSR